MTTTILTAEISITGNDHFATDKVDDIAEALEDGLLDSYGFPEKLQIKIKIIDRTVTSQ